MVVVILAGQLAEDVLNDLPRIGLGRLGQVQVNHRRLQGRVTEILLNDLQAHACLE